MSGRERRGAGHGAGTAHAGFKASVTAKIGLLMSRPKGRELVTSLLSGGFDVTIARAKVSAELGFAEEAAADCLRAVPELLVSEIDPSMLSLALNDAADHPLHSRHVLADLRRQVRHATRVRPIFVDEQGERVAGVT